MGHESAKNQQMDDHYFGSIPSRVAAFMKDLEIRALELGIPCKTRHNEVAPNQFCDTSFSRFGSIIMVRFARRERYADSKPYHSFG